jgi:hypothetical protein
MPAIGISVRGIRPDILSDLRRRGHKTTINKISIFELSAKGAKYVVTGELESSRVIRGVQAVTTDEKLDRMDYSNQEVLSTSIRLRKMMNDYVDCIILSTALCACDILLTEDSIIHGLREIDEFQRLIDEKNPNFELLSHKDLNRI